jgi:hypothetical protein
MIRKLDIKDIVEYLNHLTRVYDSKGLMSADDPTWVEEQRNSNITYDNISAVLSSPLNSIWGEFDNNGNMIKSLRSEIGTHQPVARLINFKSESTTPFNPVKSLLPMLDIALKYYESKEIYSFFLLRRLDWFSFRRNTAWEDKPPLDRYNSYYDEIIEPGQESKHPVFRLLAGKIVYPMKTAVVQMCLKQEYRTFGPDKEIYLPITSEMAKKQALKETTVCVIGVSPNKVGDSLCRIFAKAGSNVIPVGRKDVDFYEDKWQDTLLGKLPNNNSPLVIILNLYDHAPGRSGLQEEIFDCLWEKYKTNKDVQLVVIGSMAHYYSLEGIPQEYTDSKRHLRNKVVTIGRTLSYNCKLLMIESGTIDTYFIDNQPVWPTSYFHLSEFADRIYTEVDANSRFSFIMANGKHLRPGDK